MLSVFTHTGLTPRNAKARSSPRGPSLALRSTMRVNLTKAIGDSHGLRYRRRMTQRLDKVVSHAFGLSRKEARGVVRAGRVTVDGQIVRDPGAAAHPDRVAFDEHSAAPPL